MKFALVNGQRQEAKPGLSANCQACDHPLIAKCGELRVHHWAHKRHLDCDPWWENETEWHRAWKNQFPADWQEIIHRAGDGERHIADVKTHAGWVIEFQHSNIATDERLSREAYYQHMIWVVDGTRRTRDIAHFSRAWASGDSRDPFSNKRRISSPEGALLRDWAGSSAHVFVDFGNDRQLWWIFPGSDSKRAYLQYISRAQFVRVHQEKCVHGTNEFDSLIQNFTAFVASYESPPTVRRPQRPPDLISLQTIRPMIRKRLRL